MSLSAEDQFALVAMDSEAVLFPHPEDVSMLGTATRDLRSSWRTLWDFRQVGSTIYNDILDAYQQGVYDIHESPLVLASPENHELVREQLTRLPAGRAKAPQVVVMSPKSLPRQPLNLEVLREDHLHIDYAALFPETNSPDYLDSAVDLGIISEDDELSSHKAELDAVEAWAEVERDAQIYGAVLDERAAVLDQFLRGIASNSLLAELAILVDRDTVHVIPYHAHSLHYVEGAQDRVTLLRPARIHQGHWARFRAEIAALEGLLNQPNATERDIEKLLLANPLFLAGLNYKSVYPQVVLPRGSGKSFRPDVIAEPADSDWAHLIELKLPSQKVLKGRAGRASLADGINSSVRQLREYAAYFDDRSMARHIEHRYGFKCHKPQLVVIVGRDPSSYSPEEQRRAMTTYPDLEIVTYDRLLKAAQQRLLL